jgi:hypothetical protein
MGYACDNNSDICLTLHRSTPAGISFIAGPNHHADEGARYPGRPSGSRGITVRSFRASPVWPPSIEHPGLALPFHDRIPPYSLHRGIEMHRHPGVAYHVIIG